MKTILGKTSKSRLLALTMEAVVIVAMIATLAVARTSGPRAPAKGGSGEVASWSGYWTWTGKSWIWTWVWIWDGKNTVMTS